MKKIKYFFIALGIMTVTSFSLALPRIPELKQRVNDFTNTLSFQEWQVLENLLKSYEDTTSLQVSVLIIPSLEGGSIDDYAVETYEENKIGKEKNGNGVLVVIAKKDNNNVKIQAGGSIEDALTDAVRSRIIEKEILPFFKVDNYFGGIITGVDAIVRVTAGEYEFDSSGKSAPLISVVLIAMAVLLVIFVLIPVLESRRRLMISAEGNHYSSGWGYKEKSTGAFDDGRMSGGGGAGGRWQ